MDHIRAAGKAVIIRDDGKTLVIKRAGDETHLENLWDVPGGRFEYKENPHEGLKREVKEEAGLKVSIEEPIKVWNFLRDNGEHVVGTTFLCDPESLEIELGEEHTEHKWIEMEQLEEIEMHDGLRDGLKKAWTKWNQSYQN